MKKEDLIYGYQTFSPLSPVYWLCKEFIYLFIFPVWGEGEGNLKKTSLRNSLQLQHCVWTQPAKLWLQSDIHIPSEEPANIGSDEHTDLKQTLIKRMV